VATWIIVGGAALMVVILVGALLLVLMATRERTRPIRIPGLHRVVDPAPAEEPPPGSP
jgi:hypothetical protein